MESIASTVLYMASSLTPVQASGTIPVVQTVRTNFATPATRQAVAPKAADSATVDNSLIESRSRGGKSLSEAIAAEIRRDAVERPASEWETVPLNLAPGSDDGSLSGDVMAEHDARIAFIRRRIDEIRLEGASSASMLRTLNNKLHLAIAAQRLAVARNAIADLQVVCRSVSGADGCKSAPIAIVTSAVMNRQRFKNPRLYRSMASYHKDPLAAVAARAHPLPMGVETDASIRSLGLNAGHLTHNHREPSHRARDQSHGEIAFGGLVPHSAIGRSTVHSPNRRAGLDDAGVETSVQVRRLLAIARHLLDTDDNRSSNVETSDVKKTEIKLGGLLHWNGSDTWSLANYTRGAA